MTKPYDEMTVEEACKDYLLNGFGLDNFMGTYTKLLELVQAQREAAVREALKGRPMNEPRG